MRTIKHILDRKSRETSPSIEPEKTVFEALKLIATKT